MQLYRIEGGHHSLIADIYDDQVLYLDPSIDRVIKLQGISLPAIPSLTEQFGGSSHVYPEHPKFSKAVKIYLDNDLIPRAPHLYKWVLNEAEPSGS